MRNEFRVELPQMHGQVLLNLALNFNLPEKLGEDSFSLVDRKIASEEVNELFLELKSRSPGMSFIRNRQYLFGPMDNWRETKNEEKKGHELKDLQKEVKFRLSENARTGAFWALLLALHPASSLCMGTADQAEIIWPIAKRFKMKNHLRKELHIDNEKHRRIDWDDEEEAEKVTPELDTQAETKKVEIAKHVSQKVGT